MASTRKPYSFKLEPDTVAAWDKAAQAAGQSRTAWLEDAAKRRLEYGDQPPLAVSAAARTLIDNGTSHATIAARAGIVTSAEAKRGIQPIKKMGEK